MRGYRLTASFGLLLVVGTTSGAWAGNMIQWHYDGTAWAAPYYAPGSFTHGVANYLASGINNIAALTDATGVGEYYEAFGPADQYGYTSVGVADVTVTDVDSDDIRNGARIFVTSATGIQEYLWSGASWDPNSTIVAGAGYTVGVIGNDQDRIWAIQGGNIVRFDRTGATTWAQTNDLFTGPYIDLTVRSQLSNSIVFALRDDGFDEIYEGAVVRSHNGLFSGATGIGTWQDQDNLFVSTTSGLLHVRRDSGLSFTPAGVSVIDGTQGYLDVDAATFRSDMNFDLWAIAVPEPATLALLALAAGALVIRRR